jgi:hypothetical protein
VVICGLVDHLEGGLAAEEESDRSHLLVSAETIEVPGESVFPFGTVSVAVISGATLLAAVATHACWLGNRHGNSIIGPHELLATIQIIVCERQVINSGCAVGAGVDEPVLKFVCSCLHGSCTSTSLFQDTVESFCKPSATAAPPLVPDVGTVIGTPNRAHDQIDGTSTKITNSCPPDALATRTALRAKITKIVGLDVALLEVQKG